jgi:hypothetical protein
MPAPRAAQRGESARLRYWAVFVPPDQHRRRRQHRDGAGAHLRWTRSGPAGRALEDENARLKRLVADLTLDKHMLGKALRRKS